MNQEQFNKGYKAFNPDLPVPQWKRKQFPHLHSPDYILGFEQAEKEYEEKEKKEFFSVNFATL